LASLLPLACLLLCGAQVCHPRRQFCPSCPSCPKSCLDGCQQRS
jgi:hypothetical protein